MDFSSLETVKRVGGEKQRRVSVLGERRGSLLDFGLETVVMLEKLGEAEY